MHTRFQTGEKLIQYYIKLDYSIKTGYDLFCKSDQKRAQKNRFEKRVEVVEPPE